MRSIGVRVVPGDPDALIWAVVEGSQAEPTLTAQACVSAPVDADEAHALAWFRKRLAFVIEQYKPEALGLRVAERTAKPSNKDGSKRRLRAEGIALEVAATNGLRVSMAALPDIGPMLKTERSKPKTYLNANNLRGLDWSKYDLTAREAILVAVAVLKAPPAAAAKAQVD